MASALPDAWSEPTRGLAGRTRVAFEDLDPGLRHAVHVELRNDGPDPITLSNQPRCRAELLDVAGKPVGPSSLPTSGPMATAQWAVVPSDAYIGLRIDTRTAGMPTRERGAALLAVGDRMWALRAGEYVLKIALRFEHQDNGPSNQWVGELELPPVRFAVTPQMLGAD